MPKLLLFVPCAHSIVDQDENTLSLVSILEGLTTLAAPPLPEDAQAPIRWSIVTVWLHTPEDEGKAYEQLTQVVLPDGNVTAPATLPFQMTSRTHRNRVAVFGFPISQPGECMVRLSLREVGDGNEWQVVAEYPIMVAHQAPV